VRVELAAVLRRASEEIDSRGGGEELVRTLEGHRRRRQRQRQRQQQQQVEHQRLHHRHEQEEEDEEGHQRHPLVWRGGEDVAVSSSSPLSSSQGGVGGGGDRHAAAPGPPAGLSCGVGDVAGGDDSGKMAADPSATFESMPHSDGRYSTPAGEKTTGKMKWAWAGREDLERSRRAHREKLEELLSGCAGALPLEPRGGGW